MLDSAPSNLSPAISPAAAEYQLSRIAVAQGIDKDAVREIIDQWTTGKFHGIFGEKRAMCPKSI